MGRHPLGGLPPPHPHRSLRLSPRTAFSSRESKRHGQRDWRVQERSHSKWEGLASRPRVTFLPPSVMPVTNAALKPPAKGLRTGEGPTSQPHHPLSPPRELPFAGPGVSSPSVLGPSPTSPACYSWKKGKEICLFLFVYERKSVRYRRCGNTEKRETRKQKLPMR